MKQKTDSLNRPDDERCWQAVLERDAAFDGQFVTAVTTTRIYCRPSCPARQPYRKNVRFYALPQAAEYAGFRACKRCHPRKVTPQQAQLARIEAVCRYISEHLDEALTLENLASFAGCSPHYLQRSFSSLMGISPRRYIEGLRLKSFRQALQSGEDILQAGFGAGFSSSSQFYTRSNWSLGMTPAVYQKGGEEMSIHYQIVSSPLGQMLVAATERGICQIQLGEDAAQMEAELRAEFSAAQITLGGEKLAAWVKQILAYLDAEQPHFDLPLDLRVTAFQQRVLAELMRIPYGETRSYAQVAAAIGSPRAARAVGQACGSNPVPLVIPCHRVIRSDGRFDGYRYGTARKEWLLALEKRQQIEEFGG